MKTKTITKNQLRVKLRLVMFIILLTATQTYAQFTDTGTTLKTSDNILIEQQNTSLDGNLLFKMYNGGGNRKQYIRFDESGTASANNWFKMEYEGSNAVLTGTGAGGNQTYQEIFDKFRISSMDAGNIMTIDANSGNVTFHHNVNIDGVTGGSSLWTENGNNIFYNTGKVGIGTTTPQRTLDLSTTGQVAFGGNVIPNSNSGLFWHTGDGYGIYRTSGNWTSPNFQQLKLKWSTGIILDPGSGQYGKSHVGVVGGMSIGVDYYQTKYNNGLIVQGNVGIGIITPSEKLEVAGKIKATDYLDANGKSLLGGSQWEVATRSFKGDPGFIALKPTAASKTLYDLRHIIADNESGLGQLALWSNDLSKHLVVGNSGVVVNNTNSTGTSFTVPSGKVGIGTTTPQRTLDLSTTGQVAFGGNVIPNSNSGLFWHTGDGYGIYRASGNWTSPNFQQLKLKWLTGIILDPGSGQYGKSHVGVVGGMSIGVDYYQTKYNNGLIVQGNVGIGTASPTSNLHVVGDVRSDRMNVLNGGSGNSHFGYENKSNYISSAYTGLTVFRSYSPTGGYRDNLVISGSDGSVNIGGSKVNGAKLAVDGRVYISENGGTERGFGAAFQLNDNYKDFLLWVEKGIVSKDFAIAETTDWPDYVFEESYELSSLEELENQIQEEGHLPNFPSAEEVQTMGYTLDDMTKRLVKTVEELTLHTIDQEKQINKQHVIIERLLSRLDALEAGK